MSYTYDEDKSLNCETKTEENTANKKVLLLGDSIRMGYCPYTKEFLSDIADVRYPEDNCRYTQYTYVELQRWKNLFVSPEKVDVVYWNNGHWDVAHWDGAEKSLNSVECYSEMLVKIYYKLNNYFPNAEIVFSTTSPMNPSGIMGINVRTNEEIRKYNEAAVQVLKPLNVKIDDVFTMLSTFSEDMFADYAHLTPEGFEILGKHVADFIRNII